MTDTASMKPAHAARIAGAMFLFINAAGIFSEVFVRGSILHGNPTEAAQSIAAAERLYRFGIAVDLLTFAGVVVLSWALYLLLRPVGRDLAVLGAGLRAVEAPVQVAASVNSLMAVQLLGNSGYLDVFEAEQVHALSRLSRTAFGYGQDVAFVFIGLGSAVLAYLLLRSRYVPRVLAGWGVVASLVFAVYNLVVIVDPGAGSLMYLAFAPMGVYEIGTGLWLLVRGVKVGAGPAAGTDGAA